MTGSVDDLYDAFEAYRGYAPNERQKQAIESDAPATWVLAGPGTGKTETLVLRVMKLLLVDNTPPESILFTTFTNRAADNLEDRLSLYIDGILEQDEFPDVDRPNISEIWIGTLHHLANDLLNQLGPDTKEITMLDEEASLFRILQELSSGTIRNERLYEAITGQEVPVYLLSDRIHFAEELKAGINRTVEDNVDMEALEENQIYRGSNPWPDDGSREDFLDALSEYEDALESAVDFSRLQRRFLEFLRSSSAKSLLQGDESQRFSGINHVIVDEYQDTNPIQEQIYLELAQEVDSFVVVGDDDQALYRFRGASVDAMVTYDEKVVNQGIAHSSSDIDLIRLIRNYRSRSGLVDHLNGYLDAVADQARFEDARTDKGELEAATNLTGDYPPVQILVGESESEIAAATAESIQTLQRNQVVSDPRQVALLAHSTKVSPRSSFQSYQAEFENTDLPLYNPGAKNLHKDPYLQGILGIMSLILDPNDEIIDVEGKDVKSYVGYGDNPESDTLRDIARKFSNEYPKLRRWVQDTKSRFNQRGWRDDADYPTNWNFLDVFYGIVNRPPFSNHLDQSGGPRDAIEAWRFGWLSNILDSFQQNLPLNGRLFPAEDDPYTRGFYEFREQSVPDEICGVSPYLVDSFYRDLIAVFSRGGFDEVEDEVESLPAQHYPALTIHQSKGLEFPIVFAVANRPVNGAGTEHHQEDLFYPYRNEPARDIESFSQRERAIHDSIRRFFVAISRAKSLCVIGLTSDVYDGLINRDQKIIEEYPYLPPEWVESLPVHYANQ